MKYYRYLFLTERLEKKKDKIIKKLNQNRFQMNIYLIVLTVNENNHLEIINSALLLQPAYPREDYFVVGLAESYEDALELVEKMTQEVYHKTKGADIRRYIIEREQEG